jgi:UPF0271 protein
MFRIDLNADAGESPDVAADEALLDVVTSINLACGVHAGSPESIARLSAAAASRGVGVGAHPGMVEGRKPRLLTAFDVTQAVKEQVESFRKHSKAPIAHLKLHGALYHAARDLRIARAVVILTQELGIPILVAQAGSPLERVAREAGVRVASEAFLDRGYEPDGRLVAREKPGALIDDAATVSRRAARLVKEKLIEANNGQDLEVAADTVCVHGDTPGALGLARAARNALEQAGARLAPMGAP